MVRTLTLMFDVPVVAIFSFFMFYFFKQDLHNFNLFAIALIFVGVIPLFAWLHLVKQPGDYDGERKLSFIIDAISYPIGFVLLLIKKPRSVYTALVFSYLLNVIFLVIINKFFGYKASGHGAGIAGPATALTIVFGAVGALSFLFLIPVFYSKIKLKDHTFMQLLTGSLLSSFLTCIAFVVVGAL